VGLFYLEEERMRKILFALCLVILANYVSTAYPEIDNDTPRLSLSDEQEFDTYAKKLYNTIGESSLSYKAFVLALKGYYFLKAENKLANSNVLTVIDYSKPANENRFYLIDVLNGKILLKTLVAHGRNTGEVYATSFSNQPNSYKSSLGLFVTGETYTGAHGLSMRLDGTESAINDNARTRDIVVHAADYVSSGFINSNGRLGRSLGCPAVPAQYVSMVVNTIKNGSCFFAYYPDPFYLQRTILAHSRKYMDAFRKERKEAEICDTTACK
jgi:hypothetical protein